MKSFIKEHGGVVISSLVVVLLIAVCTVIKPLAAESQESFVGRFSDYASEQIDETIVDWELSNQETSGVMLKRVKLATTNNTKARFDYTVNIVDDLKLVYHVKNLADDNLENYEVTYVNPKTGSQVTVHPTSTIVNTYIIGEPEGRNVVDKYMIVVKYKGEQINPESEVSVKDYCDMVIEGSYSDKLKNLCKALLDYASYCQKKVNYKIDTLANNGTDYYDNLSISVPEAPMSYTLGLMSGTNIISSTLVVGNSLEHKFGFKTSQATGIKAYFDGEETNLLEYGSGKYWISSGPINLAEMAEEHTYTLKKDGELMAEVKASPIWYGYKMTTLAPSDIDSYVCRALYNLNLKAIDYVN